MRRSILLAVALLCLAPAPALARVRSGPEVPDSRALYHDGPSGRYLLGGSWYFRPDPLDVGLRQHWQGRRRRAAQWKRVRVPYAWNATQRDDQSMAGTTGWFRKDFWVPDNDPTLDWILRFESVNYRARIWLNGRLIGRNTGAYLPFEERTLGIKRNARNILVVRVNNVRKPSDFPPSGLSRDGRPTGGWWNYGGILREVYLRRVDRLGFTNVRVRADLPCRHCNARVSVRATIRNYSPAPQRSRLTGTFGRRRLKFRRGLLDPGDYAVFRADFHLRRPLLWSPNNPNLYPVEIALGAGRKRKGKLRFERVGGYSLNYGVRSIKVNHEGILTLNGRPLRLRGVGIHEDHPGLGAALDTAHRERLFQNVRATGARVMRTHYPLHPYFLERADKAGVFVWSEIPMYAMKTRYLARRETRLLAAKYLRVNIRENRNHPSVLAWSIGNELSSKPGPVQGYYIQRAAHYARELDPSRPVAIAIAGYPSAGYQSRYRSLDLIGINDYFGWYDGPNGQLADRTGLGAYLDGMHRLYPRKAIMVTEFGAEANRVGPVEEKGTYAFQQDFIRFHLDQYDARPWLAGAIYWTVQEFRVRPGWIGGNPQPGPNLSVHQKGLISFDGQMRKPAYYDLRNRYEAINQTP